MPELPEVETVVRDLRPLLTARRIASTTASANAANLRLAWNPDWESAVIAHPIAGVRRRGKWIIVEFASAGFMLIHLGMTGQLTVASADADHDKHCHLIFRLDDSSDCLVFRDTRRFGGAMFCGDADRLREYLGERLGPEPWDLDAAAFHRDLVASARPLKAILLDQTVVAGVGNIYADEALHRAKLAPTLKGRDTTRAQATRLRAAIVAVLDRAIASRGTTIRDYIGGSGLKGGFQFKLRVYGREGEPCAACETPVACIRLAGRATHFCPACQSGVPRPSRKASTRR